MPTASPILAALLAVAPALIAWWTGRGVLARLDDPALPEVLLERRRWISRLAFGGVIVLAVFCASDALWAVLLLWIALVASFYPIRRTLFREQWSLIGYLYYTIRIQIAQAGLWLVTAFAPVVSVSFALNIDPSGGTLAKHIVLWLGLAFAGVVLLWWSSYARVWLALHHATPLRDSARPELLARLDAILDKAGERLWRRPEIYRFGAPGGHVVNALAVPSLQHPSIALSDTLLAGLSDDEITAIFAHEVAHHEQFTRKRLWRSMISGMAFAAAVVLLPLGLLAMSTMPALLSGAIVPFTIVVTLGARARTRQDAETASDLRAAELTGDADLVATALTKVYVFNRVPRRWPHAMERVATHPSLGRRIQALRAHSASAVASTGDVVSPLAVVRCPDSSTVIALDAARGYWFEGVPDDTALDLNSLRARASSYRAIVYGDLTELRIGTAGDKRTLNATDRRGHVWSVSIAPMDVARLQSVLDTVDVKLGARPMPPRPAQMAMTRLLALGALIALAMCGEAGVVLVPILFVLFRPALTAAVAATGAIAFGRSLVAFASFPWADTARQLGLTCALATAIALIVVAGRRVRSEARRDAARRPPPEAWLLIVLLACITALFVLAVFPVALVRPESLLASPLALSAATTLAGLGAVIATMSGAPRRVAGGLTSILGLAGSAALAGNGSLYHRLAPLAWSTSKLVAAGTVSIPSGSAMTLTTSPSGESFAVSQFRAGRREVTPSYRYLIGRFGDTRPPRSIEALQVAFLDDQTLLALAGHSGDTLELRAESALADSLGHPVVYWRVSLPGVEMPRLLVDRTRRAWVLVGHGDSDRESVVMTDSIGGKQPRIHQWNQGSTADVGEFMSQPLAAFPDGSAIWLTFPGLRNAASSVAPMLMLISSNERWELRSSGPSGERVLADLDGIPSCASELDAGRDLCVERSPSRSRSRIWRMAAGSASAITDLPSSLDELHPMGTGHVAAAQRFGSRLAVVDVPRKRGIRLTVPPDVSSGNYASWIADVVATADYVILLTTGRTGTAVRRFKIGE